MINIIYPAYAGTTKTVDPFWEKEYNAAMAAGFDVSLISDGWFGTEKTVYNKHEAPEKFMYRGWILKPQLYKELADLASPLVNDYDNYLWSFEFPRWYKDLTSELTPDSFVYTGEEIQTLGLKDLALIVAARAGNRSMMVKDFLKSRKHEWYDACFIRDASDEKELVRIMTNFFNLQGRDFYGGLVFRDFLKLKGIGLHPKTRMPLPVEFRTFFLNHKPIFTTPYWSNDIEYPKDMEVPSYEWLSDIGAKLVSPFVALDIAQGEDGKWWVIEVNDGGSAGLPDHVDINEFYKILFSELGV